MTAGQHAQAFQAFFQRPLQLTCDWAHRCLLTDPSNSEYLTVLKQDRQSWLLVGPCLHPDLVVMLHDRSMQGFFTTHLCKARTTSVRMPLCATCVAPPPAWPCAADTHHSEGQRLINSCLLL